MQRLHTNAYNQLHYAYSVQLHMSIDTVEPTLQGDCPLCQDEHVFLNPDPLAHKKFVFQHKKYVNHALKYAFLDQEI